MSDDLVERLQAGSIWGRSVHDTLIEWMKERKQAADRIEELEAELLETQDHANAFATKEYYTEMRAERAEAKLEMAVEALEGVRSFVRDLEPYADQGHTLVPALEKARNVLAAIKETPHDGHHTTRIA